MRCDLLTMMHSRMRTARSLTVFPPEEGGSALAGGVCLDGGGGGSALQGGSALAGGLPCWGWGVCLARGCLPWQEDRPPPPPS